jgi:hypothetical protein
MPNEWTPDLDETVPGGAYVKDGVVVDANGKPKECWTVDSKGNAVGPNTASATPPDPGTPALVDPPTGTAESGTVDTGAPSTSDAGSTSASPAKKSKAGQ